MAVMMPTSSWVGVFLPQVVRYRERSLLISQATTKLKGRMRIARVREGTGRLELASTSLAEGDVSFSRTVAVLFMGEYYSRVILLVLKLYIVSSTHLQLSVNCSLFYE